MSHVKQKSIESYNAWRKRLDFPKAKNLTAVNTNTKMVKYVPSSTGPNKPNRGFEIEETQLDISIEKLNEELKYVTDQENKYSKLDRDGCFKAEEMRLELKMYPHKLKMHANEHEHHLKDLARADRLHARQLKEQAAAAARGNQVSSAITDDLQHHTLVDEDLDVTMGSPSNSSILSSVPSTGPAMDTERYLSKLANDQAHLSHGEMIKALQTEIELYPSLVAGIEQEQIEKGLLRQLIIQHRCIVIEQLALFEDHRCMLLQLIESNVILKQDKNASVAAPKPRLGCSY